MKKLIVILLLVASVPLWAQERRLTLDEYLSLIKTFHPVALQAEIGVDRAFFMRREALGAFDPKLELTQEKKVFNGTNYYDYVAPEIKLPLWYGMDLKGSYTTYSGNFVNPENKVPEAGLGYVGLNVPLGRGLMIDERRAALKQANIFKTMAANEQEQMLNQLFVDASSAYLTWLNNWLNTEIYRQAVKLAEQRADGVKLLFKNGDRPAIDTLEALILLQSRKQKLNDFETKLMVSKNQLASFLWLENTIPVDPELLNIIPDSEVLKQNLSDSLLNKDASVIAALNPEVKNYGLKIQQLEVDRRLKLDQIKPNLSVNLGLLNSGRNILNNLNTAWFQNNQKFGLTFSMPLTFTKQRASYSLAKLKLKDAEYAFVEKKNLTVIKWENYKKELQNLDNQIKLYKGVEENSFQLLKGEEMKFKAGESSLFLVNSREQKLLEVRELLNEYASKRVDVIQNLRWIANAIGVE